MIGVNFLGKHPTGKWAIIFIAFGLGVSLSYVGIFIFGYNTNDLTNLFNSPSPADGLALGWANALQQLGMFGFTWLLLKNQFNSFQSVNESRKPLPLTLVIGCFWLVLSYGFIEFLGVLNQMILGLNTDFQDWAHLRELSGLKVQTALLANNQGWPLVQVIFLMAFVPGIFEELFFRSILLRWKLSVMRPIWAITLNGFIFSFIHFQFEGFLARWLLGIMLGWIYWKTGKIGISIGMHILNNALSIFLYVFVYQEMNFSPDHWIHHPIAILSSSLFFIVGWKAIDYLWRPKGIYS